jgi:t-SNARE complex subunit (syntaxin)
VQINNIEQKEINETSKLLEELEALHEIFTEFHHLVDFQDKDIQKIQKLLEQDNEIINEGIKNLEKAENYKQRTIRYSRIGIMTCIGSIGFFSGVTTGCVTTITGTYLGVMLS